MNCRGDGDERCGVSVKELLEEAVWKKEGIESEASFSSYCLQASR